MSKRRVSIKPAPLPSPQALLIRDRPRFCEALDDIVSNFTRRAHYDFDTQRLALLYMTPADLEEQKNFTDKYLVDFNYCPPTITTKVTLTHPLEQVTLDVPFEVMRNRNGTVIMWPRWGDLKTRPDCDQDTFMKFFTGLADFVQAKVDLYIYKQVVWFIRDKCTTIEQMRYLFPPILRVFGKAALWGHLEQIREVRKVPGTLPVITPLMRAYIKHANQWCAIQEMLDNYEPYYEDRPRTHSPIWIDELSFMVTDADGSPKAINIT